MHLQLHQNRVNAAGPFSVRIFVYSLAEKCPDVTITISNGQLCILKCIDCKSYCHTFDLAASHAAFTTAIVHLLFQITKTVVKLSSKLSSNEKLKPCNAVIAKVSAICFAGAPGEDRTRGLLIRSETLYPLSYERMISL